MKGSTETTCHCGAEFKGSDHCPHCFCEQYEAHCDEVYGKPVHELSLREFYALPPREAAAVRALYLDVQAGRVHAASSHFDLSPRELADERVARAWAVLGPRPVQP